MIKEGEINPSIKELAEGVYFYPFQKTLKVMYEGWEINMKVKEDNELEIISETNYTGGWEYELTPAMRKAVLKKARRALDLKKTV